MEISDYKAKWDSISNEKIGQFALSQKTVQEAVSSLMSILNMKACNNTGNIKTGVYIVIFFIILFFIIIE